MDADITILYIGFSSFIDCVEVWLVVSIGPACVELGSLLIRGVGMLYFVAVLSGTCVLDFECVPDLVLVCSSWSSAASGHALYTSGTEY